MGNWYTAQKMKFSMKDFFSKCDRIRRNMRKKSTEEIVNGKFNVLCSDIIGDPDTQIINIYLKF